MISVENNVSALNAVYNSMAATIANMSTMLLINNADEYTGISSSEEYLRTAIEENKQKVTATQDGQELVSQSSQTASEISDKVAEVKELAEKAASGTYSAQEVQDMQADVQDLLWDIDKLAQGDLGEEHLLTEDGTYTVEISDTLSISIDTKDLTSDALDLDSIDLTTDPSAAVTAAEAAITEIDSYSDHLASKAESLEAIEMTLDVQATSFEAAKQSIESIDSAYAMVSLISSSFYAEANIAFIAQANVLSQTALRLLSDT